MTYLALEDTTGRRLSVLPFATLKGAKDYLEWHYPQEPVYLTVDLHGQPRFTVAGTTVVVTAYAHPYGLNGYPLKAGRSDPGSAGVLAGPLRSACKRCPGLSGYPA